MGDFLGEKRLGAGAGGFAIQRTKSVMAKLCSSMRERLWGRIVAALIILR